MLKHKLWRPIIFVLSTLLVLITMGTSANAAKETDLVKTSQDLTGLKSYLNVIGDQVGTGINYPSVSSIKANNTVKIDGKYYVTNKTNQIIIKLDDKASMKTSSQTISDLYYDVFGAPVNGYGKSFVTGTNSSVISWSNPAGNSVNTVMSKTLTVANLGTTYPAYVGIRIVVDSKTYTFAVRQLLPPTLTPTINEINPSDTTVTGTAVAGNKVSITVNGTTSDAIVKDDGSYEINLGSAIGNAGKDVTVTQTEPSDAEVITGGSGSATKTVNTPALSINGDSSTTYSSSDLDDLTSDTDVVSWLVKRANLTPSGSSSTGTVTYSITDPETGILDSLKNQTAGDANAKEVSIVAKSGNVTSDPFKVKIIKNEDVFGFVTSSLTGVNFGTENKIPSGEDKYGSSVAWSVPIKDTRLAGSPWYLVATASKIVPDSTNSNGYFNGGLEYADGNGNETPLTNASVEVAHGSRAKGTTEYDAITTSEDVTNATTGKKWDVSSDNSWNSSSKGIFLDALSGTKPGAYTGTVTWSLLNTPKK